MKRLLLTIGVLVACGSAHAQQARVSTGLSPVPLWPSTGVIEPQFADRYAFLDVPAKQLVLYYPENLGRADFASNPGVQRMERIDLHDQVKGAVTVTVKRQGNGFVYAYRLSNATDAKQPIARVDLTTQAGVNDIRLSGPQRWSTAIAPAAAVSGASMFGLGTPVGGRTGWQVAVEGIAPGGELAGFALTSSMQPGITMISLGSATPPKLHADLPRAVYDQAALVIKPGQNMQSLYTVGPMFNPQSHMLQKVASFQSSLTRMVRANIVDPNSPAISEALAMLDRYLKASQAQDVPLETWTGPPLTFTVTARPGLEAELMEAMKTSLK